MAQRLCMGCMAHYEDYDTICPYCGYNMDTPPEEPYHLLPGTVIGGKYIVGKAIGYGGFSVTYIGYDYSIDKKIAIKEFLPSEFATRTPGVAAVSIFSGDRAEQFDKGVHKFIDEAKRLAQFRGTGGVSDVYDVVEENNTAYIVMEYLEGETLKEYLAREQKVDPYTAVEIMLPIIRTLKIVHSHGLLHRDIAPDNIYLTTKGEVKLIDFGAARQATSTSHSKSLSVIVKPGYAPPEQYRSRGEQGPWTDVYGCGATLYKMITGVTPEDAMERDAKDDLEDLSDYSIDIPENIETAVMNAMNLDIEERTLDMDRLEYELTTQDKIERIRVVKKRKDFGHWPKWMKISMVSGLSAVVLVAILITVGIIGGWIKIGSDSVRVKRVPNIVNMAEEDAKDAVDAVGISLKITDKQESDEIPKGCVLSQSIDAGVEVEKDMVVEIVISGGVGYEYMPNLVGELQKTAVDELETAGMHVKVVTGESEIAPGYVYEQSVTVDEKVERGTEIVLSVSTGDSSYDAQARTTVPSFTNASWEDARTKARDHRVYIYKAETSDDYTISEDKVTKQDIKAKTEVNVGREIGLSVSLSKKRTHVPDVQYKKQSEAEELLTKYGLTFKIEYQKDDTVASGCVISQSIPEGEEVDSGTEITLVVSEGKEQPSTRAYTEVVTTTEEYRSEEPSTEVTTETTTAKATTEATEEDDDMVYVPSVVGMSDEEAIKTLNSAGLNYTLEPRNDGGKSTNNSVLGQDVAGGSTVERGTYVHLLICDNMTETVMEYRYSDTWDDDTGEWTDWSEWEKLDEMPTGHGAVESRETEEYGYPAY